MYALTVICLVSLIWVDASKKKASEKRASAASTVEGLVYADNSFEFFVDGKSVASDPLLFQPHQAVKFSFDTDTSSTRVYAVKAKDWADSVTGYQFMGASKETDQGQKSLALIGDGALRVLLSDGTVSNSAWKCMTTSYGPTEASVAAGCSTSNFAACRIQNFTEPSGWKTLGFDDSAWQLATEYTDDEAGWGVAPTYDASTRECSTRIDPVSGKSWNPSYVMLDEDQCLDPLAQDWGTSVFIWQPSMYLDNTILCRIEVGSKELPKLAVTTDKKEISQLKREIGHEKKKADRADVKLQQLKAEIKENKEVLGADKAAVAKAANKAAVMKKNKEALSTASSKTDAGAQKQPQEGEEGEVAEKDGKELEEEVAEAPKKDSVASRFKSIFYRSS